MKISFYYSVFKSTCKALVDMKYKKVSAKIFHLIKRRVKKNMEEGRGFRIMGGKKKGTSYEFASSNHSGKQQTLLILCFSVC